MSKIYTSADQLIGKTPLMELTHIEKRTWAESKKSWQNWNILIRQAL